MQRDCGSEKEVVFFTMYKVIIRDNTMLVQC